MRWGHKRPLILLEFLLLYAQAPPPLTHHSYKGWSNSLWWSWHGLFYHILTRYFSSPSMPGRNKLLRIRLRILLHSRNNRRLRRLVHRMSKEQKKFPPQVGMAAKICGSNHRLMKCGSKKKCFTLKSALTQLWAAGALIKCAKQNQWKRDWITLNHTNTTYKTHEYNYEGNISYWSKLVYRL